MNYPSFIRVFSFIALLFTCLSSSACQFTRSAQFSSEDEKRCRRAITFSSPAYDPSFQQDFASILPDYPNEVKQIASSLGLMPELRQLAELEDRTAERPGYERPVLLPQHRLLSHVTLIMLEGNSAVAEARCEEARVKEIVDHLQRTENRQTELLTLVSVITGGIGGLLSGAFALAHNLVADATSAIAGGALTTTIGTSAFLRETQYELEHSRNILKEIWEKPAKSTIFPPSVWSFLTSPRRDQQTPRELLIEKWKNKAGISEKGSEEEEERASLLFSDGGTYELADLRARATMLDLLASTIELMNQDIEMLMREVLQREDTNNTKSAQN